eukprot:1141364-Pelagomonas_calceolata.AAC.4
MSLEMPALSCAFELSCPGAAVVTGRAGAGVQAVASHFVGVAGIAPVCCLLLKETPQWIDLETHVYSFKGTLASLDGRLHDLPRLLLIGHSGNWRPLSITWRPENVPLRSPIPPRRAPCCFNRLDYFCAQAHLSWSMLAACPFLTAPPVFCPCAAAPAAGGGWSASLSLLFVDQNERCLRPGVAIAGAAVVTGRAGEEVSAVAFCFVWVAGTARALGGSVDAVGACPSGTAAAAAARKTFCAAYVHGGQTCSKRASAKISEEDSVSNIMTLRHHA